MPHLPVSGPNAPSYISLLDSGSMQNRTIKRALPDHGLIPTLILYALHQVGHANIDM